MFLDESQLEQLYSRYCRRLNNFAAHFLGDEQAAKDVVHDAFLKLFDNYRGKDMEKWAPLLYSIVRSKCIDALRRRVIRSNIVRCDISELNATEWLYSTIMSGSADEVTIYEELKAEIYRTLETLPERNRRIFVMSRLKGLTNKEIASAIGISEQAVKNQISKALKIFRSALRK